MTRAASIIIASLAIAATDARADDIPSVLADASLGSDVELASATLVRRRGHRERSQGDDAPRHALGTGPIGGRSPRRNAVRTVNVRQARAAAIVFSRASADVSACYGKGLHRPDRDDDRVEVSVRIDPRGRVVNAEVLDASRWGDWDLEACLTPVLKGLRFARGMGPVELRYAWRVDFVAIDLRKD